MIGQLTLVGRITYSQESLMTHSLSKVGSESTIQLNSNLLVIVNGCSSTNVLPMLNHVLRTSYIICDPGSMPNVSRSRESSS